MITYIGFNDPFLTLEGRPSATVKLSNLEKSPDIIRHIFNMLNLKDAFNMCVASRGVCHIIYQSHLQVVPFLLQKFGKILPLFKKVEWSGFAPSMPLNLDRHSIKPEIVGAIPPNVLSIVSGTMSDRGFQFLPQNLKSLDLSRSWGDYAGDEEGSYDITDQGLRNLPRLLIVLNLSGCRTIRGEELGALPGSLTSLNLNGCNQIGKKSFKNLPQGLLCLHLGQCDITDEEIRELPRGLHKLGLWGTKITDAGLKDLPSDLEHLSLAYCEVTDKGLEDLPSNLKFLNLNGCTITPKTIKEFSKWLPAKLSKCRIEALDYIWNGRNRICKAQECIDCFSDESRFRLKSTERFRLIFD